MVKWLEKEAGLHSPYFTPNWRKGKWVFLHFRVYFSWTLLFWLKFGVPSSIIMSILFSHHVWCAVSLRKIFGQNPPIIIVKQEIYITTYFHHIRGVYFCHMHTHHFWLLFQEGRLSGNDQMARHAGRSASRGQCCWQCRVGLCELLC